MSYFFQRKSCVAAAAAGALFLIPAFAQDAPNATASFINAEGQDIGTAQLSQTPNGVLITLDVEGLPPGEHGFHIHETGECDASDQFQSAGGHYAPEGSSHGYKVDEGPHAGDMPNQAIGEDGRLAGDVFNSRVTLSDGESTLFDDDGSAIVVHASADDYESQPSGDAGDRLACAVIERQ